ncbi:MAG: tyrosine-type recombinase/integrase [Dehalogenimonas sp.]
MVKTARPGKPAYHALAKSFQDFIQSKTVEGVTINTIEGYERKFRFISRHIDLDTANRGDIERFLLQFKNPGNRHGYFRVIRAYYNWRKETTGIPNPMGSMKAPRLPKLILPALNPGQVKQLIECAEGNRNKAIIALFTESGLRLSELVQIKPEHIDWDDQTVRVMGKGQKEALAPFGKLSEEYLTAWLSEYTPTDTVWGINKWGITAMLRRLEVESGITCNPHTFRRTFACILRKAGMDTLTIKDLGRWESLEMVQRYTRSVNFADNLKFYKTVMG